MVNVQRLYVNGKLERTTKPNTIETLRKWMDNAERDWSKNLPMTESELEQMRGANQGKKVTRVSIDELIVVTTEDKVIRFVNVERNK